MSFVSTSDAATSVPRSWRRLATVVFVLALSLPLLVAATPPVVPFDSTGDLLVLDGGCDCILRITPDKGVSVEVTKNEIRDVTKPGEDEDVHFDDDGLAVAADNTIYFTETFSDLVLKKPEGGALQALTDGETMTDPDGLALSPDGSTLYAIDDSGDDVYEVDPDTGAVSLFVQESDFPGAADLRKGITVDEAGDVYLASDGPDVVFRVTPEGTTSVVSDSGDFADLDVYMTRDAGGDVIVADDAGGQQVFRVKPVDGTTSLFLTEGQIEAASSDDSVDLEGGIAFDSDGNFYIAEENEDEILRFDTDKNGEVWVNAQAISNVTDSTPDFDSGIAFLVGNEPPTAGDDSASTPQGRTSTIDVLANDTDPDGDPLSVTLTASPADGAASVNSDQTVDYQSDAGFVGTDSFTYDACDPFGGCDGATVTIQVREVNQPPRANHDEVFATQNRPVRIDVLANDTNPDGSPSGLEVSAILDYPTDGTASVTPDGNAIVYVPDDGFVGDDALQYQIRNEEGRTHRAKVFITVEAVTAVAHVCPGGEFSSSHFEDVPADSPHLLAIECMAGAQLVFGTTPSTFSPEDNVRRDQVATLAARVLRAVGADVPDDAPDAFTDRCPNAHELNVDAMAALGIVEGYDDGTYGCEDFMLRGDLAAVLVALYEHASGETLEVWGDHFSDDDGHPREEAINKAFGAGFAVGRTADAYGPDLPLRRDQTASFFARVLDHLVRSGHAAASIG